MRKNFSNLLYKEMSKNKNIVLITADLGYGLWDKIRLDYPNRFINTGSSEQLATGIACGAAMEGKIPFVYSITPFLLYRPYEIIRNYVNHENLNVKLVGGGRDKDYGYLGFSHWAEDDIDSIQHFSNIRKYKPENEDEMSDVFEQVLLSGPCYINLRK
jgi:transketolase